jgi:TP901 family phage tail tape measure protein
VVDYLFRVAKDDVSPRFRALEQAQRHAQTHASWGRFERAATGTFSRIGLAARRQFGRMGTEAAELFSNKFVQVFGAAGLGLALKKGLTDLAGLDDQISGIAIKLRQPAESLREVRQELLAFSQELGITDSAQELARSVNILVGADYELAEAMVIAKAAARGAAAAQTDSSTVTRGATAVMKGFNIEGRRSEEIIGKMIRATDLGVVEMEDLSNAMVDLVGPSMQAGASIEEVLALLETLSISGVSNAAEASTSIARLLERFASTEFRKKSARLGIQVVDESGNLKSPIAILEMIRTKFQTLNNDVKRSKFLEAITGGEIRAKRALLPLLQNMEQVKTAVADISSSGGRLDEAFEESQKRLSAKFARFKNVVTAAGIDVATLFEPAMQMFSDFWEKNFDPRSASGTFADNVRGMLQMAAEEVEAGGWGKWFWERVIVDPLKFWMPKIGSGLLGSLGKNPVLGAGAMLFRYPHDGGGPSRSLGRGGPEHEGLMTLLQPKIEVNNQIDAATGKTRTEVSVSDPNEWGRRVPLEP